MKRLFLFIALLAGLAPGVSAFAQTAVDQSDPQALIKTATQQVLDEVRTKSIAPDDIARIRSIVDRDILPYVDFQRTTRLAMGRHWRTATPASASLAGSRASATTRAAPARATSSASTSRPNCPDAPATAYMVSLPRSGLADYNLNQRSALVWKNFFLVCALMSIVSIARTSSATY